MQPISTSCYNQLNISLCFHALSTDPWAQGIINVHDPTLNKKHILYHFNPRFFNNKVFENSCQHASWGTEYVKHPNPVLPNQPFKWTLVWSQAGFEIYIDDVLFSLYKHRVPLPKTLYVDFPTFNDYGDRIQCSVYSIEPLHMVRTLMPPERFADPVSTAERTLVIIPKDEFYTEDVVRSKLVHFGIDTTPEGRLCFMQKDGKFFCRLQFQINVNRATEWLMSHDKLIVQRTKEAAIEF